MSDEIREALAELVRLKDGPHDDAYRAAKEAAWERARVLIDHARAAAPEGELVTCRSCGHDADHSGGRCMWFDDVLRNGDSVQIECQCTADPVASVIRVALAEAHEESPGSDYDIDAAVAWVLARLAPSVAAPPREDEAVTDGERRVYAGAFESALRERDEAVEQRDVLIEAVRDSLGERDAEWFPDGFPDHLAAVEVIRWLASSLAGDRGLVPSRWAAAAPGTAHTPERET